MVHTIQDPVERVPLNSFSSPVETRVSTRVGEITAAADVRANWSRLEVRVVEPEHLAGITFVRDHSGYATAIHAGRDPSSRFTYARALTAGAIRLVQRFLVKVTEDHVIVARHANEIAEQCLRTHRRLLGLADQQSNVTDPAPRSALKRCFKRGELDDRDYQSILRRLRELKLHSTDKIDQARSEALADVAEGISSSPIPFEQALVHLSDPQILATLGHDVRSRWSGC